MFGMLLPNYTYISDLKEVFIHRVDENYGNILKWVEVPSFNPILEKSIMVGDINLQMFY